MNPLDIAVGIAIFQGVMNSIVMYRAIDNMNKRMDLLEKKRELVYKKMADVGLIENEMERGARLREMHDAHRTTLPRDDAVGQHARVFRPPLRGKEPSLWNPPRPVERPEKS